VILEQKGYICVFFAKKEFNQVELPRFVILLQNIKVGGK